VAAVKFVKTDIGAAMSNINATAYLRLPFTIDSQVSIPYAAVRYDDSFVAYLNGTEVARAMLPAHWDNFTATNTSAATVDVQLGPRCFGQDQRARHPGLNWRRRTKTS
jgi:hypothetical protein